MMASVSSLDKDLRAMRLDKYTPARANEVRKWIESVLNEALQGDLLDALKDGTILCRLANIALGPNTVRFKTSSMPFVQMENISHFLRVCQAPPLNLPAHDIFLTVDLYESKDPAQVLQCIEAFSRKASALQPGKVPTAIGGRKGAMSPEHTGTKTSLSPNHARGTSISSLGSGPGSGRTSPTKSATSGAPAWNYAQYGWMGGASQGNQGVAFGSRRQITAPPPNVPSLADKERKRKEAELEAERQRHDEEIAERNRQAELEQQEAERRLAQERQRAEDETRKREEERLAVEAEKRRWEEEERRWRQEEDDRIREEKAAESRLETDRQRRRANSDARLTGQLSSQYQAEQEQISVEKARISELEKQLAEAKAREQAYEDERQRIAQQKDKTVLPDRSDIQTRQSGNDDQVWEGAERDYLRDQWKQNQTSPRPLPKPQTTISPVARPLPVPTPSSDNTPSRALPTTSSTSDFTPSRVLPVLSPKPEITPSRALPIPSPKQDATPSRPLPNPSAYKPSPATPNRTEQFLSANPAPISSTPNTHTPSEATFSSTSEFDNEAARRKASQAQTKAGGWASKSLLEREMERERQRQQEWEEAQKETADAAAKGLKDVNAGSGPGQSWDVNSYGFTGGDNLNRGSGGVFAGRRQILGPRPLHEKK